MTRTCHYSKDGVCAAMSDAACLCPDDNDLSIEALVTKVEFGMDSIISGGATDERIKTTAQNVIAIVLAHIQKAHAGVSQKPSLEEIKLAEKDRCEH